MVVALLIGLLSIVSKLRPAAQMRAKFSICVILIIFTIL